MSNSRSAKGIAIWMAVVAVVLCNLTQAFGQLPQINPDGFTPATTCGQCHQAIHAVWSQSLHSKAWSNSVFQAGYRRAKQSGRSDDGKLCLSCHAPTVLHTKDYDFKEPITSEGITCDFCHSVTRVDAVDPAVAAGLDVGLVKYGPLKKVESPTHKVADSPLHTRSEFCALCHEYRNSDGLLVLGTYSEWKSSSYARRGIHCQNCHMPLVPGRTVALNIKEAPLGSVNLHDISGSHDLEQVRKAITLKLENTDWIGDRVWVNLQVANIGSGHCFPTGLPMHRAVLEVVLRNGSAEVARREIPFSLILLDDTGREILREHEAFTKAAAIKIDTRIRPEEFRPIEITFRDIKQTKLILSARVMYEYSTETLTTTNGKESIEPVEMRFLVASVEKTLARPRH